MIKITLANGKQIADLTMNGNNYVSESVIDRAIFSNNLHRMLVEKTTTDQDGNPVITKQQYENMSLVYFDVQNGKTYFVINPVSELEMQIAKIRSNIDYLAMMTGNDIAD